MSPLLQLQKLPGKGDGGWKESLFVFVLFVFCFVFITRRSRVRGINAFWGILLHEQHVIACCQTRSDYGPPKMSLKLAV